MSLGVASAVGIGVTLGLSAGLSPGPMTALVVRQSLAHGTREGLKVAVAPVLTDGPLLVVSALLAGSIESMDLAVGVVGIVGAAFLTFLAWESAHTAEVPLTETGHSPAGSIARGVATNLVNPHPYVFWLLIGGPMAAQAHAGGWAQAVGFVTGFFGMLCGSKALMAWAVGSHRERLGGPVFVWTMRLLALVMLGFAASFAWDGAARIARAL